MLLIELNFCVGCMVSQPNRLLQDSTTMSLIYKILFFQVYIDVGQDLNELNRETGFAATIDAMFALIVGTRQLRWSTCHQRLFS